MDKVPHTYFTIAFEIFLVQILYQKVGLTPNGGPGSVAGLSTSGCMCVYVCVCVCGQWEHQ